MEQLTKELIPDPYILINGLRDTGYDLNTALADIIDNSLDANASIIKVMMQRKIDNSLSIMVIDNGCGMNKEELLNGMMYGSRREAKDQKRLGKFGLGLKTASTAFSKRLSVISKNASTDHYLQATWDLDLVARENKWNLLMYEEKDIDKSYLSVLEDATKESGTGTLVAWERIDRIQCTNQKQLLKLQTDLKNHVSKIYHRFLDVNDKRAPNVQIEINGDTVLPWDPFCLKELETHSLGSIDKKVSVLYEDNEATETKTQFHLSAYAIPTKFMFSSDDAFKESRSNIFEQGFYVYRENRMISYSTWLGLYQKESHARLCRIEFSFNHELDVAFKVDVKKSQITLNPDLADWLQKAVGPFYKAAQDLFRQDSIDNTTKNVGDVHQQPDKLIADKEDRLKNSDVRPIAPPDTENHQQEVEIRNKKTNDKPFTVRISIPEENDNRITIFPQKEINDGLLWEPTIKGSHHGVIINTSHPYYQKVYVPNHKSSVVMDGLDSLLWALSESELSTLYNMGIREAILDFRTEVSRQLRTLVEDMPDPEEE